MTETDTQVRAAVRRATFIRHGESMANIGQWDGGFAEIPLTDLGEKQAERLASAWDFTPDLIVVSPYLRTQQTAEPTIARFSRVPVETWPIHEFTFWDPSFWSASSAEDTFEMVERFWRDADPDYRHAQGTESFRDLLTRTEQALLKLELRRDAERVLLFTHGHFIQALRHTLLWPEWTAREKMTNFRAFDEAHRVRNTDTFHVERKENGWRLL
jgi:probable phosphoglycerate mutase